MSNKDKKPSEFKNLDGLILESYISLSLFWMLCITVLMGFISRYVFNSSLTWTEEISRYLLIALVFIGSSVAISKKAHIAIEFFYYKFDKSGRFIMSMLIDTILVLFFLFCSVYVFEIALSTKDQNMVSVEVSKSYLYLAVFLGFVSMAIRLIIRFYKNFINKEGL